MVAKVEFYDGTGNEDEARVVSQFEIYLSRLLVMAWVCLGVPTSLPPDAISSALQP